MTARDDLIAIIITADSYESEADAIIAAGWTPPPAADPELHAELLKLMAEYGPKWGFTP